jgi:hypothetical protein
MSLYSSSRKMEEKVYPWYVNSGWELNGIAFCVYVYTEHEWKCLVHAVLVTSQLITSLC